MRMLREARNRAAVIHPPAVGTGEVHADVSRLERRVRTHVRVRLRIPVEMMYAEEEGINGGSLKAERGRLQDGIGHGSRLRPARAESAVYGANTSSIGAAWFARFRCSEIPKESSTVRRRL